jgi:hypothetical protein
MDREYIEKLVDQIIDGDNTNARETYSDVMSTKITDALEGRKKEIAQSIYDNDSQEEIEPEEEETQE